MEHTSETVGCSVLRVWTDIWPKNSATNCRKLTAFVVRVTRLKPRCLTTFYPGLALHKEKETKGLPVAPDDHLVPESTDDT